MLSQCKYTTFGGSRLCLGKKMYINNVRNHLGEMTVQVNTKTSLASTAIWGWKDPSGEDREGWHWLHTFSDKTSKKSLL